MNDKQIIYIDGSSRGNPGPGSSVVVHDETKLIRLYQSLTNNQAEYMALLMALEYIVENNIMDANVLTDSQLIVGHMLKGWKINKNHDLVQEAKETYDSLFYEGRKINIEWVPRKQNIAGIFIEELQ